MSKLEIDKTNKTVNADLDLKGEQEGIRITFSNHRLIQEKDKNPLFEPGTIEISREWLNVLFKALVKMSVIPERMMERVFNFHLAANEDLDQIPQGLRTHPFVQ